MNMIDLANDLLSSTGRSQVETTLATAYAEDPRLIPGRAIILHRDGSECILGAADEDKPSAEWIAMQTIPFGEDALFYTAYPLSGGACSVDLKTVTFVREATWKDIEKATTFRPKEFFNPAAKTILSLWDQSILYRLQDGTEMTLATILETFTDTDGDRVDDPQDIGALRGEECPDGNFVTVGESFWLADGQTSFERIA